MKKNAHRIMPYVHKIVSRPLHGLTPASHPSLMLLLDLLALVMQAY